MISFWGDRQNRSCFAKRTPLNFFSNWFKKKKYKIEDEEDNSGTEGNQSARVGTSLSVSVMDMRIVSPSVLSPALSTLTLTPGRTRDIDQDMEALRLSRQDNPFLQVLASRESLVDSLFEPDFDEANLMSQDDLDIDPLSLPEIHEHMIRSPPPTTWPKSPNFKVFKFPNDDAYQDVCSTRSARGIKIPDSSQGKIRPILQRPHQRSKSESRHRVFQCDSSSRSCSNRSMSDVRRAPSSLPLQ